MFDDAGPPDPRHAALGMLRALREMDARTGVKHSGIARDVGLLLYERGPPGLAVSDISAATGYSGPTVRLVLDRLAEAGSLALGERRGKTQYYHLSAEGVAGFAAYVEALIGFAERLTGAGARRPLPDRPADRPDPQARYAAAPPAPAAAE
jgi:DNA-binding transcriptional ArsR family regulator